MFIEIIIISLLLVKIKGGEIKNLEKVHIRAWQLILIGFIIQLLSFFFVSFNNSTAFDSSKKVFGIINLINYLLITTTLVYNSNYKGFKLMSLGNILNIIPMILNKGRMPVYIGALSMKGLERQKELLLSGNLLTHSLVDKNFSMFLLSDIIPIPEPYFMPKVISIGDISLALGIMIFIITYSKMEIGK